MPEVTQFVVLIFEAKCLIQKMELIYKHHTQVDNYPHLLSAIPLMHPHSSTIALGDGKVNEAFKQKIKELGSTGADKEN